MLGPFATMSRLTPIHQVSPLYCRTPPAHRCPQRRRRRRQRQRVTEGTAMASWNGSNKSNATTGMLLWWMKVPKISVIVSLDYGPQQLNGDAVIGLRTGAKSVIYDYPVKSLHLASPNNRRMRCGDRSSTAAINGQSSKPIEMTVQLRGCPVDSQT